MTKMQHETSNIFTASRNSTTLDQLARYQRWAKSSVWSLHWRIRIFLQARGTDSYWYLFRSTDAPKVRYILACVLHKYISVVLTVSSWGPVQTWVPMIPSLILTNITCIFQYSISFCHWFFQFSYKTLIYIKSSSFFWVLHHWKDKTLSLGTSLTNL